MLLLLSGMACAVFFFTRIVPLQVYMFTDPELVYGLFFGLIVGSIVVLTKAIEGFSWIHGLMIGLGTFIGLDRKSTRLNSSHVSISYAVFCLKKKTNI